MDDIVITGDDIVEIVDLKKYLAQEFEVKDLGQLTYFHGIEISRGPKGMLSDPVRRDYAHHIDFLG
jgi:hypothetical protein